MENLFQYLDLGKLFSLFIYKIFHRDEELNIYYSIFNFNNFFGKSFKRILTFNKLFFNPFSKC